MPGHHCPFHFVFMSRLVEEEFHLTIGSKTTWTWYSFSNKRPRKYHEALLRRIILTKVGTGVGKRTRSAVQLLSMCWFALCGDSASPEVMRRSENNTFLMTVIHNSENHFVRLLQTAVLFGRRAVWGSNTAWAQNKELTAIRERGGFLRRRAHIPHPW
jgi:hypothetical protein